MLVYLEIDVIKHFGVVPSYLDCVNMY